MNKRAFRHTKTRDKGFTLVELMVTVAILVILLAIGAPQLQTFLVKRSVSTQADIFASALRMARSEAIKRGQRVAICPTSNPDAAPGNRACTAASTDWSTGWFVFVDSGATAGTYDATDQLLSVQQAFTASGGIIPSLNVTAISFSQNGLPAGFNNGSFRVKPKLSGTDADSTSFNKCVFLATSGRVRFGDFANGQCVSL